MALILDKAWVQGYGAIVQQPFEPCYSMQIKCIGEFRIVYLGQLNMQWFHGCCHCSYQDPQKYYACGINYSSEVAI